MTLTLNDLKPLNLDQYEQCRSRALERVAKRIGNKPTRKQFARELGRLWSVLDIVAGVVFVAALVVSSIHIIVHMGNLANVSYSASAGAGTNITQDLYVAAHQWMMIFLAEGSMILFLVMFGMGVGWRRWVSFGLALLASLFVLIANWQSGIGLLESLLAPAFTIGIGLRLEHLIVQTMHRRADVDSQYLEAMSIYEAATADATQHPDYMPLLRQELWQKLVSLKVNNQFADAPTGFKHLAVKRELAREAWAHEENAQDVGEFNASGEESKPAAGLPFGVTAPALEPGGPESTPMTMHGNGRMTENAHA